MKTYNEIDIPLPFEGDCEFPDLDHEFQERDKAIVELWDAFIDSEGFDIVDKKELKVFGKYKDFVTKTRAIYGM